MELIPIAKMLNRVDTNEETDSVLFHELLYAGEFVTKMTVLALVTSIDDNRENHPYRFLHGLVRADGIGTWGTTVDQICTGPAAQSLSAAVVADVRVFTERIGSDDWRYDAVRQLHDVLEGVDPDTERIAGKVSLRTWFTKFVQLRNKTRGHGAITPANCARLVGSLRTSLRLVVDGNPLFGRPWAYLHRNLSGKYNVVSLGGGVAAFDGLKTARNDGTNYPDGVYLWVDRPRLVALVESDIDASDFFVANGGFNGRTYELHSPITDDRYKQDAGPYLAVSSDRPPSETEGAKALDVYENVLTNMPNASKGYVKRPQLETKVRDRLLDDRHPIITLVGRGGIGKTSLALTVLDDIARLERYEMIIWFSARDIDLTSGGPKLVQPKTLTEKEIAKEYANLLRDLEENVTDDVIVRDMRDKTNIGNLFVFDNFETLQSPVDLYQWIDNNISLPNKAFITSRFRDFKADFPIEVSGMEHAEAKELVQGLSVELGIANRLGSTKTEQIIEESNGHPYVIKIILGEIADKGTFGKPSQILARKDGILEALFERTYKNLSPLARRIFLTLSGWRSLVLQLAMEAVVQQSSSEGVDPETAVDELIRMSLIERRETEDGVSFLEVPVAAGLFGRKKLEVSPYHRLIQDDIQFLSELGPTKSTDLKKGSFRRIQSMFRMAAKLLNRGNVSIDNMRPVLKFIARNYPRAWLLLADLEKEVGAEVEEEIACVQQFLQESPQGDEVLKAWLRLVHLYRQKGDIIGSCNAFLNAAKIEEPELYDASSMANYLNGNLDILGGMDAEQRSAIFRPVAQIVERHREKASATDLSRLAWLYLHCGEEENARRTAEEGLEAEPYNVYCVRLVKKLSENQ